MPLERVFGVLERERPVKEEFGGIGWIGCLKTNQCSASASKVGQDSIHKNDITTGWEGILKKICLIAQVVHGAWNQWKLILKSDFPMSQGKLLLIHKYMFFKNVGYINSTYLPINTHTCTHYFLVYSNDQNRITLWYKFLFKILKIYHGFIPHRFIRLTSFFILMSA